MTLCRGAVYTMIISASFYKIILFLEHIKMGLFFIRCIEYFDGVVLWCGLHHDNCCTTCFYTIVAFLGHFQKGAVKTGMTYYCFAML